MSLPSLSHGVPTERTQNPPASRNAHEMATTRCRCSGRNSLPVLSPRWTKSLGATTGSGCIARSGRRRRMPAMSGTVSMSKTRIGVMPLMRQPESASGQVLQRVNRFALPTNFKVQLHSIGIGPPEVGDALAALYRLTLLHENLLVVGISGDEFFVVLDDHEVAVTPRRTADIHHFTL